MIVRVLFFATLKDIAQVKEISLEVPEGATLKQLKSRLVDRLPRLQPSLNSTLASVNREFASDGDIIPEDAEVAFFPPVSGGNLPTLCIITQDELELDTLLAQITLPSTGAACIFTGLVRGETSRGKAHQTVYLDYEAYVPMAETKMYQVADEIRVRWPTVEGIAIIQRIGRLTPGTPTVVIACTAPHRDTGVFDAARFGIDRLKEIVPVWKKEVAPDGEIWVEGDYFPRPGE
jgi:MoaE-MoaD fusion protein